VPGGIEDQFCPVPRFSAIAIRPGDKLVAVGGRFKCSCCGEMLDGPPLAWHFDAPDLWNSISPAERNQRGELSSDQCVIDNQHFFVRGLVEIPALDGDGPFACAVKLPSSTNNLLGWVLPPLVICAVEAHTVMPCFVQNAPRRASQRQKGS
jgi:Uncharacterized protein conserved in bacteria (DUF2199)